MVIARTAAVDFAERLLRHYGATDENASVVAEHLVRSSEIGLFSHGLIRIPEYVVSIGAGALKPDAAPVLEFENAARAAFAGNGCFGQVAGMKMAAKALALANKEGCALVTGCGFGHTGRLGAYVELISAAGLFGIAASGGSRPPSGNWVAPYGGKEARLGTNPLAFSFPADGSPPIVGDFATSTSAEGSVRSLRNRQLPVPPGTLRDSDGNASVDADVLYRQPPGTIEPLGGPYYGYKGTALGVLVGALSLLAAEQPSWTPDSAGMAILAIRGGPRFAEEAGWTADYIRACPPVDRERPVLMPGDREHATGAASKGISIDAETWKALQGLADRADIQSPKPADN